MAVERGEGGTIQFGLTTAAEVLQVKSWTMNPQKAEIITTSLGSTFKSSIGSIVSATFTADVFYESTASGTKLELQKQAFATGDNGTALVKLYTTASKFIQFSGLITYMTIGEVTPGAEIMLNVAGASNGIISTGGW